MKITAEQWADYEIAVHNHRANIQNKRDLLAEILIYVTEYGVEYTRNFFTDRFDTESSMCEPNKPGYYRAAND